MDHLRTEPARLQDVVAVASSLHHMVGILTVVRGEKRSEWVKEWLLQQAPGSKIAELDVESNEHEFYKQHQEGDHLANGLHTEF